MNLGLVATTDVTVNTFTPQALSFLPIPGFANAVAVQGDHAYVAAGAAGLQIVDVSDPRARELSARSTPPATPTT